MKAILNIILFIFAPMSFNNENNNSYDTKIDGGMTMNYWNYKR